MKLGRRAGHLILIAATLAFAFPMILTGIANSAQGWTATTSVTVDGGQVRISEPVSAAHPAEEEPDLVVPTQPVPPPQNDVPGQQEPTQPAQPPATTEPTDPPVVDVPDLPVDVPPVIGEPTEPAPEEPAE